MTHPKKWNDKNIIQNPLFLDQSKLDKEWTKAYPTAQLASVEQYFNGALPGAHVDEIVYCQLEKLGISKDNAVFAQSSCPDELNHDHFNEDISRLMRSRYGGVFHLGGLAGIPFTGMTGWAAFSHHVPKDGHIVLLYAPHVGITVDGTVGKVHRPGQDHSTSACGASIGAYKYLLGTSHKDATPTIKDEQMDFIKNAL